MCNIVIDWEFFTSSFLFYIFPATGYFCRTSLQRHWFWLSFIFYAIRLPFFVLSSRSLVEVTFRTFGVVTSNLGLRQFILLRSALALSPTVADRRRLVRLRCFLAVVLTNLFRKLDQACRNHRICLLRLLFGWVVAKAHCQRYDCGVHNF